MVFRKNLIKKSVYISVFKNKRKVIGCENSKNYIELSINRIEKFTEMKLNTIDINTES